MVFGFLLIKDVLNNEIVNSVDINSSNLVNSFVSVLFITISSPMTILFFTGLFMAKASEYNYTRKDLFIFGFGVGFATFLFMTIAVVVTSIFAGVISVKLVQILNIVVGILLISYGLIRLLKRK